MGKGRPFSAREILQRSHQIKLYLKNSPNQPTGEPTMKAKITEDWLSVIIAFALMVLALVGIISPSWMKF